jgi:hypothetical protein
MVKRIFILLLLFAMGSSVSVKGQNSSITPEYIKSNLIQFLISENVIEDKSEIGMSFYLGYLNAPVDSSSSHIIFPVEIKPDSTKDLQIGFYQFGIISPHLEPYLVIVGEDSFDIISDYSVPAILSELELFMREDPMDFKEQLILAENVIDFLFLRQSILDSSELIEIDFILNPKNK